MSEKAVVTPTVEWKWNHHKTATNEVTIMLKINPCHAELIQMQRSLLIFSQSDYLIQTVDTNSYTQWQTVQIQISSEALFAMFRHIWVQQD